LNKNQIAKKYSKALLGRVEITQVPSVIEELKAFSQLIDTNRKLKLLFAGQIFSEDEKEKALGAILPGLKFLSHTERFLKLIVVQGHLAAIKEVIAATIIPYNESGKSYSVVISSVLDKNYSERLRDMYSTMTQRKLRLRARLISLCLRFYCKDQQFNHGNLKSASSVTRRLIK
jgi:F0F1-type ATP synthase delta subunit